MAIDISSLPSIVDVAAVLAGTRTADVDFACKVACAYGCASVIVNPCFLADVIERLNGRSDIMHGSTASFPFGCEMTSVKIYEAEQVALSGAQEIDMVMNVGAFLSGNLDVVKRDISLVRANLDVPIKVIIEAPLLNDEQIAEASELVVDAGASCVKTSTGLYDPATPGQVRIIRETVGTRAGVKAAGGIRTVHDAVNLVEAGADRLGISAHNALRIFREIDNQLGRTSPEISETKELA